MPRLVVSYGRVSTQRQADRGALERQERALLNRSGADETILDVGSGTTTRRKGYQRLCQLIADGDVAEVRIADQDRLNRNVQADLEFFTLCRDAGTKITDLNGRELELTTPDGELLTTVVSALNQHRSKLYRLKVKRALQGAREQGRPAVAFVPYGLRKTRDHNGRLVGIEIDPDTRHCARQRIEWFLAGNTVSGVVQLIADHHGLQVSPSRLKRWFLAPQLTGRLAWLRNEKTGEYEKVAEEQTFEPIITDVEAAQVRQRLKQAKTIQGLAGRQPRMLTGLCRCSVCGSVLTHRQSRQSTLYLRCCNRTCPVKHKAIRCDRIFAVLQFSLPEHAKALLPLLDLPKSDPPEVSELLKQIKKIEGVPGVEEVIEDKRRQINALRANQSDIPTWMLIGALRSPMFWLQDDSKLNSILRTLIDTVTVEIRATPMEGVVKEVRCRTSPAIAPLPQDQDNIRLRKGLGDLVLAAHHEQQIAEVLKAIV